MRTALLVVVVLAACSKKAEQKKQEPTPTPETAKPAETKPAEAPKPPEEKPAPPPTPAAKLDCNALLTADDLSKACGKKLEIEATRYEGQGALMVCNRTIKDPAKHMSAQFGVSSFNDGAAIDAWIKLTKDNSKESKFTDVTGIGEGGYEKVHEVKGLKSTDYDLAVRKGNFLAHYGYMIGSSEKPVCTMDQLKEVAKLVASRMP